MVLKQCTGTGKDRGSLRLFSSKPKKGIRKYRDFIFIGFLFLRTLL